MIENWDEAIGLIAFWLHFSKQDLEDLTIQETDFFVRQIKKNIERKYGTK